MKKKNTANLIMIAAIVVIAVIGLFFVGKSQGWFGSQAETTAAAESHETLVAEETATAGETTTAAETTAAVTTTVAETTSEEESTAEESTKEEKTTAAKETKEKETKAEETKAQETTKATTAPETTAAPATTAPETTPEETTTEEDKLTCTIRIKCNTILDNMDMLDPDKVDCVPSSGTILGKKEVEFEEGETVYDVLKRVCDKYGIHMEASWTPMYNSYYIEGINYLYEFDCGSESGWMYKVNGWFPNYGCSSYYLEDGDSITWCYTCVGLGADVGGSNY